MFLLGQTLGRELGVEGHGATTGAKAFISKFL
jgi:hypothetical protein